jgi:DNA-binding transcriptional ArsR family regulator
MLNRSQELDRLFHALADPARRAILERLGRGPAPVSELAKPLPMSLPAAGAVDHGPTPGMGRPLGSAR